MSNALDTNPIKLDTAGSTAVISRLLWVVAIRWVPGADPAAGDAVILQDKNGNVFWHAILEEIGTAAAVTATPQETSFSRPVPLNGLIPQTLADGTVYIYTVDARNG